eukprot:TRINITY_DN4400_c0_g3_i5.p1 TRINITY_DN4400_c0_g3~~TRINITY_DN4400_c0_g3_i5.p1  ORF type:complete len:272 (-),score=29.52 TRINITY_DN4400_c0_g3_i5:408-1223(-)
MLERVLEAFKAGYVGSYYYIFLDMESITFWKLEIVDNKLKVFGDGPKRFGGKWNGYDITFPSEEHQTVPVGFLLFVSLLRSRLKAAGETPLTIINDEGSTETYYVKKSLGLGRDSVVYSAVDGHNNIVSIKLEPVGMDTQIKNEISVLRILKDCKGVPVILCDGMTTFQDQQWRAIVTDVVGDYSLDDYPHELSCSVLSNIAKEVINILQNMHQRGIIYNDMKPNHIMFSNGNIFLIDFGSAGSPEESSPFITNKYCSPNFNCSLPPVSFG